MIRATGLVKTFGSVAAVDGLSSVEAGKELGLGADVVRQHKCRWIKRLRDRLREQFGELLD